MGRGVEHCEGGFRKKNGLGNEVGIQHPPTPPPFRILYAKKAVDSPAEIDHLFQSIVLPNITYAPAVFVSAEPELTVHYTTFFFDRCFKRKYLSEIDIYLALFRKQDKNILKIYNQSRLTFSDR